MARKSTIRLLLINESENEGERIISAFRNAGRVARAQRASSLEDLRKLLDKEQWDLLIADSKHPEITIEQALEQLGKSKVDFSAIAIHDESAVELLEAGASDVIASGDDKRLVLAAFRELEHLDNLRELNDVREKLNDAEERSELLLAQSQDAIAYVADGMLISSNNLFAGRFGFDDPDELDCAPVIDLIDAADQEKFKSLLKAQLASGEGSTDFGFTGVRHGGETFAAAMQLSHAVVDGETCIQLSVRDPGTSASGGGGSSDKDALTGLYSASYMQSQIDSAAKQAAAGAGGSVLLFVALAEAAEYRPRFGLHAFGQIMKSLAEHLQAQCPADACIARYCDDAFCVLLGGSGEDATSLAETLCSSIAELSVEIGDQGVPCHANIGVNVIDSQAAAEDIIDNAYASAQSVAEDNDGAGGVEVFVPAKEKRSLGDAADDAELDKLLEEALEDNECVLIFQPVVSLRGTSGDHYEVQTHMIKEDGTEIDAEAFLDSLNFTDVNTRLDRWIILEASKQLSAQIDQGNDTRLFINLTSHALRDDSLVGWLGVALKAGGIPAEAIAFQFHEADLIKYLKAAKSFSKAIRQLGCKMSITNFGDDDGHMDVLKGVNADFVKVDASYTEKLLQGNDAEPLKALVNAASETESQSIITGVENAAALAQLWQLGVDYIQGAYLAGPSRKMDYEFTDIA